MIVLLLMGLAVLLGLAGLLLVVVQLRRERNQMAALPPDRQPDRPQNEEPR